MAGLDFSAGGMDWGALEKNLGANITSEKKNYKDDRFWTLSRDENDNGVAMIRLLPDPNGTPFIQIYNHAFQSFDNVNKKKRWYINNSPQTIGEKCPASDLWSAIFNEGSEEGKAEAKNFTRKISFYANIKVIKDPSNPQNDGKVFIWKFGTKLKDKIMAALNPSEQDIAMGEEPKQLFNPLTGCNIKLKIKKAAGFLNYDDTTIETPSSIYADAEAAKADIIENAHKLDEFLKPDAFETYEELLKKLKYVVECYNPKNLSPDRFAAVIAPVIGKSQAANTSQTTSVQETAQPVQEPVQETVQPVQEPVQTTQTTQPVQETAQPVQSAPSAPSAAGDDLSFLDDL
jgi:hypothetical protein